MKNKIISIMMCIIFLMITVLVFPTLASAETSYHIMINETDKSMSLVDVEKKEVATVAKTKDALTQVVEINNKVYVAVVENNQSEMGIKSNIRVFQYDIDTDDFSVMYQDMVKQEITQMDLSLNDNSLSLVVRNPEMELDKEIIMPLDQATLEIQEENETPIIAVNQSPLGDVDGDGKIRATDALKVLQHSVSIITLYGNPLFNGDVNGDNIVNSKDALMILQYSVKIIDAFPRKQIVGIGDRGIDISVWNTVNNWSRVKADNVKFAFIRTGSGHGTYAKDRMFNEFYNGATSQGIPVGAYHYSYALTTAQAEWEAELCLESINGRSLELPIAFDIEDEAEMGLLSRSQLTDICIAFCEKIKAAGYQPAVYANLNWFNNKLDYGRLKERDYTIWLAQYNDQPTFIQSFDYWQYSSKGVIDGTTGYTDLNKSYTDVYK